MLDIYNRWIQLGYQHKTGKHESDIENSIEFNALDKQVYS